MKEFILALGGVYFLILIAAYLFQSRFVFFPDRVLAGDPGDVGLGFEEVWLDSGGQRIHGWFIPAEPAEAAEAPRATLLFCHGNGGNIGHRLDSIKQFHDLRLSVLIFDYRGYGQSEGKPGERKTYQDARAAWDYLTGDRGLRPDEIVLFGRSLGGAVAIELATETDPMALVIESSFTSAIDMGARLYPWLPIRLVRRIRYDSLRRVGDVDVPKLFIHSIDDEVIPFGMGKRLYGRARRPKQFLKIHGGHQDGFLVSAPLYTETIDRFLDSVQEMKGHVQ
jgi:fermentation-respiration switch protein FrsA (DUF1100 family)